jgi:hypothetical protein
MAAKITTTMVERLGDIPMNRPKATPAKET